MHRTILIMGDSVALGASSLDGVEVRARVQKPFPQQLAAALSGWNVIVDAAAMRTTLMAAERVASLLDEHRPDALLLATGANDVDLDWRRFIVSKGSVVRSRTPPAQFAKSVALIADAASTRGVRVFLCDTMTCHLSIRLPYLTQLLGVDLNGMAKAAGGQPACDGLVRAYRETVERAAESHGAVVASFGSALDRGVASAVHEADGTHPNQAGHDLIAAALVEMFRTKYASETGRGAP
jgi:lysophospholipase L1-like esterase